MNLVELNEQEGRTPLVTVTYLLPPKEAEHGPKRNICTHFLLGDSVCAIDVFIRVSNVF